MYSRKNERWLTYILTDILLFAVQIVFCVTYDMKGAKTWLENKDRETDVQEGKISDSLLKDRIFYPHVCFLASVSGFQLESTPVLGGEL